MSARLGRTPRAAVWLGFLAAFAVPALVSADDRLAQWVENLAAPDFALREEAGRQLVAAGVPAIDPLALCLVAGGPEARWRAASALEQIGLCGDAAAQERVAEIFERLARGDRRALGEIAHNIRSRQRQARQSHAVQQFVALGGQFDAAEVERGEPRPTSEIAALPPMRAAPPQQTALRASALPEPAPPPEDAPPSEDAPPAPGLIAPAIADAYGGEPNVSNIQLTLPPAATPTESLTIDANWRGGDRGLAILSELPRVSALALDRAPLTDAALEPISALTDLAELNIIQTPISSAALCSYRQRRPQTCVLACGEAMLGASANLPGPCVLTSIEPDSAAGEAGLKIGDEIVAAAGRPIRDLSDLTIAIYGRKPGERVPLEFSRSGQKRTIEVSLKAHSRTRPGR